MNTNTMELNLNEMATVNGGMSLSDAALCLAGGGCFGGLMAGCTGAVLGLATGPIGWAILGGAAVGSAAFTAYGYLTEG